MREMDLTAFHAKYYAHELTRRRSADSMDKLAGAVADAQVDLNPHQVEAALFAAVLTVCIELKKSTGNTEHITICDMFRNEACTQSLPYEEKSKMRFGLHRGDSEVVTFEKGNVDEKLANL
jgi:hypothetical protein